LKTPPDLNDAQWQAVISTARYLLIVAGPGTGKTHTLTGRIARQAADLPPGRKILAITFTNKAAEEMRQRLDREIPDLDERVMTGTFHQFCLSVLRKEALRIGLPRSFKVIAPQEAEFLAHEFWPAKKSREIKLFLEEISRLKADPNEETWPDDLRRFSKSLRQNGLLDFDDLLRETLLLWDDHPDVLKELQSSYQDIFVDEFQDINPVQHALIKNLVGNTGSLTAIGDPCQAIYGFRGSDVRFFESFEKDFPAAKIMTLVDNYRSMHNLLNACGQMIAASERISVPALTATIYQQGRLIIQEAATDKAEAEFVVHQIEKLVGGVGMFSQDSGRVDNDDVGHYSFGDVAVLFRLNSQVHVLKKAFDRLGIPYRAPDLNKDSKDIADDVCLRAVPEPQVDGERVSLMTLHAAKGLEFPVVFIVGCNAGLIPLKMESMESDPQEERRLFYVGMTRAKERLYLISAGKRFLYGKFYQARPSSFLADIDQELKEVAESMKRTTVKKNDQQMNLFKM